MTTRMSHDNSTVGHNGSFRPRYSSSRSVSIHSPQTCKKYGEIVRMEQDRVWGNQYLVRVVDAGTGYDELFWFMDKEITHI